MTRRAAVRAEPAQASADTALVERARSGDEDAREQLVRRYLPDVYRTTVRVLGDPDLAQDAAQDAFVNAMGGLPRFRGDASFRTWLLRIAINAARSVGRRNGRRREVSLVLAENEPTGKPDPARRAVNVTESERAERALDGLPTKQRLAVALRVQQGLSYTEIASSLNCSEGAARVNYHLGVKKLRELLR
ncbi:MAG TPA: RNA polymerase sigma factor [Longimicrobiales bacterium]|nr:RNA polymerase sigma factor [Longimicrobiales bacterium]